MNNEQRHREFGGSYETAILDVYWILEHVLGDVRELSEAQQNELAKCRNRLRGVLEASGRLRRQDAWIVSLNESL